MPPTGPLARRAPAAHHPHALVLGPQPGLRAMSGVVEVRAPPRGDPGAHPRQRCGDQGGSAWVRASETQVARTGRGRDTAEGSDADLGPASAPFRLAELGRALEIALELR
jgi:hypothetical protein